MTYLVWAADGKRTVEMVGKIWLGALKEKSYHEYDENEVIRLYVAGLTIQEVIEQTECPKSSVYAILRRAGRPLR